MVERKRNAPGVAALATPKVSLPPRSRLSQRGRPVGLLRLHRVDGSDESCVLGATIHAKPHEEVIDRTVVHRFVQNHSELLRGHHGARISVRERPDGELVIDEPVSRVDELDHGAGVYVSVPNDLITRQLVLDGVKAEGVRVAGQEDRDLLERAVGSQEGWCTQHEPAAWPIEPDDETLVGRLELLDAGVPACDAGRSEYRVAVVEGQVRHLDWRVPGRIAVLGVNDDVLDRDGLEIALDAPLGLDQLVAGLRVVVDDQDRVATRERHLHDTSAHVGAIGIVGRACTSHRADDEDRGCRDQDRG